jgi:autotransporter passenger strand-loop-strand repeat protein
VRGGTVSGGGGSLSVLSGGTTVGAIVSGNSISGGGGKETVASGGTASGTTVDSGGTETVFGKASGGTINGGLIEVASGGTASGTLTFVSGGTLQLDIGAGFTGKIKGFTGPSPADRIDLRGIAFGSGTTEKFTQAASLTSGTLKVTDGTHTVQLTLLGTYVTSNFKLATDGKGGTLVTDPPVVGGGASQTTFADIAPAPLPSGAPEAGNLPNYLAGAVATNLQAYAGETLLATGPPDAQLIPSTGGANHHPLLPDSS